MGKQVGNLSSSEGQVQRLQVAEYSPQQIEEIEEVFRQYRKAFNAAVRGTENPKQLYREFLKKVRDISRDEKLPLEVRDEVIRLKEEAKDILRELMEGRESPILLDEKEISARIVDDVKTLSKKAKGVLPEMKTKAVPCDVVSTDDLELDTYIPDLVFPSGNVGSDTQLPKDHPALKECGYKGGVARLCLKLYVQKHYARFDQSLLDAELPLSDKDAIFGPSAAEYKETFAEEMGVDLDGIELREDFDVQKYLSTRDTDMNEVLLVDGKLYFTPRALGSIMTGVIHGNNRAQSLFGVDAFYHNNKQYLSGRMVHRLVKSVAQGKAKSFEIPSYNLDIQLGIYWLVLVRKGLIKRSQNNEQGLREIAAVYDCARQMGQTEAATPAEFVQGLLDQYPQFGFTTHQSDADVARWVMTKYTATMYRYLKKAFQVRTSEWPDETNNSTPVFIQPDAAQFSQEELDGIAAVLDAKTSSEKRLESTQAVVDTRDEVEQQVKSA